MDAGDPPACDTTTENMIGLGMAPSFIEILALVKKRKRITIRVVTKIFRYVVGGIINGTFKI